MVQYLRETIAEMDSTIREIQERRTSLALRLAVLETATDSDMLAAVNDLGERLTQNRPYPDAVPAQELINEAYRRFGPQ
jgi:hypothetical protein